MLYPPAVSRPLGVNQLSQHKSKGDRDGVTQGQGDFRPSSKRWSFWLLKGLLDKRALLPGSAVARALRTGSSNSAPRPPGPRAAFDQFIPFHSLDLSVPSDRTAWEEWSLPRLQGCVYLGRSTGPVPPVILLFPDASLLSRSSPLPPLTSFHTEIAVSWLRPFPLLPESTQIFLPLLPSPTSPNMYLPGAETGQTRAGHDGFTTTTLQRRKEKLDVGLPLTNHKSFMN